MVLFHLVVVQLCSKDSETRTLNVRNTRLFELNLGHTGFRKMGQFINHFNNCVLRTYYVLVRKGNVSFTHQTLSDNMLINVKMPTIVCILTFISMINITSESLKARNFLICWLFSFL